MTIPFRATARAKTDVKLVPNVDRRIKKDFRLWLGIALLLFSIFGITNLLKAADSRTTAVVLANDVSSGQVLTPSDLRVVKVSVPNSKRYVASISSAVGMRVLQNMQVGELIPVATPSISKVSGRIVSIPIRAGHLPAITDGDLVDIWSTPNIDSMALPGPPKLVARSVSVLDVPSGTDPNSDTAISVVIREPQLKSVIAALRDGLIDVVAHPSGA